MGLLFADGFDSYSASADLARNWQGNGIVGGTYSAGYDATSGRTGGGCFKSVTTALSLGLLPGVVSVASAAVVSIAFWGKWSAVPSALSNFITIYNSAGTYEGGPGMTTGGKLCLVNNGGTSVVAGGTTVTDNAFHWVEFQWLMGTGTQRCDVDGVSQWNGSFATGIGAALTMNQFNLATYAQGTIVYDDIIVYDSTVAQAPQNSSYPLGPRLITTLRPNGDDTVQFARSAGANNYALVNEQSADDDTTYVQDATSGDQDLYTYGDLGYTPSTVTAVQLISRIKNPNPGTANFKNRCKSVSTVSDGASTIIPSNYYNYRTAYNLDPATAAAWLPAAVDAAKFGLTRV